MLLRRAALILVLVTLQFHGEIPKPADTLVTHEWGTFTSVARIDGTPIQWTPLSGPPDLPCFIERLGPQSLKLSGALVRMETPVLYFYAPQALSLSVHVSFPQGWITEWYPKASRVVPERSTNFRPATDAMQGEIDWASVNLSPTVKPEFPSSRGASHYYAARNTDSVPLRIGDQQEKFIFYRGIGNFSVPLEPKFADDGKLEIRTIGSEAVPLLILFENRGGRVGYRMTRGQKHSMKLDPPELAGDLADLQQQMTNTLVEFGLYRKEAQAMTDTWKDSWFEEGMRVFYIVPRAMVDRVLPLTITPTPASLVRVFVGRVEVLSPWVAQTIETAAAKRDIPALAKFDRFLLPFASQLNNTELFTRTSQLVQARASTACIQ